MIKWDLLHKVISKHCGGVSKQEFWQEWDMPDISAALALVPKDIIDQVILTYQPVSTQGGF